MVRIALAALTASFAALACAVAAPPQGQPPPAVEAAETAEQQPQAAGPHAPVENAPQTAGQQAGSLQSRSRASPPAPGDRTAAPVESQADAPPAVETSAQPGAGPPRFRVEAIGFRAVDESGPNHPDSDAVFAVFESQGQSMVTRVFESVDTGDAKDFAAGENCVFPAEDADEPRNGAWQCSPEGAPGPMRFAIALYELDPDYLGSFTARFCTPEDAADVEARQRQCNTEHSSLLFRSEFSYQAAESVNRIRGACRCFTETVRYRESNARGAVEYHVTFRITRTDEEAAAAIPASHPDSARPVFRHGARSAALGQGFELDGGVTAALGPDLAFSRAATTEFVLAPSGGAKIWPGDYAPRGYAACHAERRSASYVTTAAALAVGQYVCYVTNSGRVGELRVDNLMASANIAVLSVTFTTWQ